MMRWTIKLRTASGAAARPTFVGLAIAIVACAGCEWGGGPGPGPTDLAGDAGADSRRGSDASVDGGPDAATDAPPAQGGHLLLTEIALAPNGAEFVEIVNPLAQPVDLTNYFLANHGSYFQLPAGAPTLPSGHFIVQFTAGTTIAPGAAITVATGTAAAFSAVYGTAPTYSITDGTITKVDTSGSASLTDTGTAVVLFAWDGASPLVQDVDIMIAGIPGAASALADKSGVTQNGATYAMDAFTIAAQPTAPGKGVSTKRIAVETGHETQAGTGNGITGHDETSEDTAVTWDTTFTAPTPNQAPAL
jgi:hypothetical protein